jgi:hypothetical protein
MLRKTANGLWLHRLKTNGGFDINLIEKFFIVSFLINKGANVALKRKWHWNDANIGMDCFLTVYFMPN